MSRAVITKSLLTAIANAIRAKTGGSTALTPAQMAAEIAAIPAGDDGSLQAAIGLGGGTINYYGAEIGPYALYYAGFNNAPYSANGPVSLVAPNATKIDAYALANAKIIDLSLPAVATVGVHAFDSAYFPAQGTHIVDLPAVVRLDAESPFYSLKINNSLGNAAYQIRLAALTDVIGANTFSYSGVVDISQGDDQQMTKGIYLYVPELRRVTAQRAFTSCSQLRRVNLPFVTTLGASAFYGAYSITSVDVAALRAVPSRCFYGCWQLPQIDLYDVSSIGSMAFYNCQQLTKFVIHRTDGVVTLQSTDAFTKSAIETGTGYIYVPDALVDQYKTATNWVTYANQIKPLSEYTPEV